MSRGSAGVFDVPRYPLDLRRHRAVGDRLGHAHRRTPVPLQDPHPYQVRVVHLVHRARAQMTALGRVSATRSYSVTTAARDRLDEHRVLEVDHGRPAADTRLLHSAHAVERDR
ncbi:hypothetical protein ACWGCP_10145 [Streptomyces niveus]